MLFRSSYCRTRKLHIQYKLLLELDAWWIQPATLNPLLLYFYFYYEWAHYYFYYCCCYHYCYLSDSGTTFVGMEQALLRGVVDLELDSSIVESLCPQLS